MSHGGTTNVLENNVTTATRNTTNADRFVTICNRPPFTDVGIHSGIVFWLTVIADGATVRRMRSTDESFHLYKGASSNARQVARTPRLCKRRSTSPGKSERKKGMPPNINERAICHPASRCR
jgi:hypothetical protein